MIDTKQSQELYNEDARILYPLREKHHECMLMYVGDHWELVKPKPKPNRPTPVINFYKKHVDVVYGTLLSNRRDIKVFPVEGGDDVTCDIRTRLLQWIFSDKQYYNELCLGGLDAWIGGLGWVCIDRTFDNDIINGDIQIKNVKFDEILFDPYIEKLDLSDCSHIFRSKYIHKDMCKVLWPEHREEFEYLAGKRNLNYKTSYNKEYAGDKDRVQIIEHWYADYEDRIYVIDTATEAIRELNTGDITFAIEEARKYFPPEQLQSLQFVPKKKRVIKLKQMANFDIELFHGNHPDKIDRYPFIPIFGYYTPSVQDWKKKVQGAAEVITDIQLEINKIHASIMYKLATKKLDGYTVLEDAQVDMKRFLESDAQVVAVKSHDDIRPIPQPELSGTLFNLANLYPAMISQIGHNPELMGISQGSTETGISLQIKQRQAVTIIQQLFNNFFLSHKMAADYINDLISMHFSENKIKRILGEDAPYRKDITALEEQVKQLQIEIANNPNFDQSQVDAITSQYQQLLAKEQEVWQKFELSRLDSKYDCRFGEIESTPTHRMAMVSLFEQFIHQGKNVPDEILMEYLEMPKDLKERWMAIEQQAGQSQQEMMQQQQQFQLQIEQMKQEMQLLKQQIINYGQLQVEAVRKGLITAIPQEPIPQETIPQEPQGVMPEGQPPGVPGI